MRRYLMCVIWLGWSTAAWAAPGGGAPVTTGERVNYWIDNLQAAADRLLELPVFVLLLVALVPAVLVGMLAARAARRSRRPGLVRALVAGGGVVALLAAGIGVDRRVGRLQEEIRALRGKAAQDALLLMSGPATAPAATQGRGAATAPAAGRPWLFDLAAAQVALKEPFGAVTLQPRNVRAGVDFVQMTSSSPQVQACVAVVDLGAPGLRIELGTNLAGKTLTSQFARERRCVVAINGEAGNSPAPFSGLGPWRGVLMQEGKTLQEETSGNPRPFLAFDRGNRATFRALSAPARGVPADAYNVIWGRLDALIDGTVQTAEFRNRQPRTAMGIDRAGMRLVLLVADGRQFRTSVGMTRAEVGQTLKAFGAAQGMLCDEGGSSCMWLEPPGRIVNTPSDNGGQERATYTHFGIAFGLP